jgi:hypothetical protein
MHFPKTREHRHIKGAAPVRANLKILRLPADEKMGSVSVAPQPGSTRVIFHTTGLVF